ncbi:hypothetical protein SK128_003378, partial [Halocaridina rubra]
LECTPCKHRGLVGMLLGLPFGLYLGVIVGIAYEFREWRYTYLSGLLPCLILLPISL